MKNINEAKFYQALEGIFTGANIEGESGYVNLLKIKSSYYKLILEKFKNDVDNEKIITGSFKEEFFDKLYSFFEKYFSESGSVYFVKTANWQRVYEQVYTDNKDVVLFWKTHMLYYVKSDILFQSIDVEIEEEETLQKYNFKFDVGKLKNKQNNEKKAIIFEFREVKEEINDVDLIKGQEGKKVYVFDVLYSERGRKTKTDDIIKKTKIPEAIIEKAFKTFKKQSEVDFFINKNADKFLNEQLDMYLHQTLLDEENKFNQARLDQLKTIKTFAKKIISFIAQFEDELVRIWNKPKFALNSNYVITLDKLSDEIVGRISEHNNLNEQIKEWQELGMVNDSFVFNNIDEKYKHLPIDTKYFKDLELDILGLFDNLDEELDGRLIHSENYQALNTLQERDREKVQCIYIDPPFNTGSDFAYVDKFQDSTWLSLMNDRIELARKFLRDDGSFYLHLDYRADYLGKILLNNIFLQENYLNNIIWNYGSGGKSEIFFGRKHDDIFLFKKKNNLFNADLIGIERGKMKKNNMKKSIDKDGREYYSIKSNGKIYKYYQDEKVVPNDVWNISHLQQKDPERVSFNTQKPEKLLERILVASSNENTFILDFFTGSATTIATAHKLNRKWLGVEMGEHFDTVDIPRMKTVLSGKISGISKELEKENKLKKGGFFKYYSLEQYENTLRNMKYKDYNQDALFNNKKPFEQYVFFADQKFAHIIDTEKENLELNFDNIYENIDFAETISNLKGLPIKKITKTGVLLEGEEKEIKTDYKNMTENEKIDFIQLLKPLLWWSE